jgi:hypothetical protein
MEFHLVDDVADVLTLALADAAPAVTATAA